MYLFLIFVLACVLGWALWRKLRRSTLLHPALCAVLAVLFAALAYILLFWASVYLSIFLFQAKDG